MPKGYILGNGRQTIEYTANGEASDWMLHELGIFAMSPELGNNNKLTNDFFVYDKGALVELLDDNYGWIEYTIKLLFEKVRCYAVVSEAFEGVAKDVEDFSAVRTTI